jgi:hypothetical protein
MTYDNTWVPVVYNVLTAAQLQQMVDNITYLYSGRGPYFLQRISGDGIITSFDFTTIDQTYSHLELIYSLRSAKAAVAEENLTMRCNNDSGNNYNSVFFRHRHSNTSESADVASGSNVQLNIVPCATATAGFTASGRVLIPKYRDTTFFKTINGAGQFYGAYYHTADSSGMWKATTAISRLTLSVATGPIMSGSECVLYGWL